MPHFPYQLTAPTGLTLKPDTSGTFQVFNTGTKPLVVTDSLGRYTTNALQYPAADHATLATMSGAWVQVTPSKFTLQPGQAETVHITSRVPAGAAGNHYLNVLWSIAPVHAKAGAMHAAGGPATTVTVPLAGVATPVTAHSVPVAPPAPGHGPDVLSLAGLGLVVLAVLAAIVILVALRRRRGTRSGPYLA
jgi:hypothetical protein